MTWSLVAYLSFSLRVLAKDGKPAGKPLFKNTRRAGFKK
jgi:hypothetical protein